MGTLINYLASLQTILFATLITILVSHFFSMLLEKLVPTLKDHHAIKIIELIQVAVYAFIIVHQLIEKMFFPQHGGNELIPILVLFFLTTFVSLMFLLLFEALKSIKH